MQKEIGRFFQFSRREEIAILILLFLLLTGMGITVYRGFHGVKTNFDEAAFRTAVSHLQFMQDSMAAAGREGIVALPAVATDGIAAPAKLTNGRININTADARTLAKLPRIGTRMAERIIAFRKEHGAFQWTADLEKIPGIGTVTYEHIKNMVRVD